MPDVTDAAFWGGRRPPARRATLPADPLEVQDVTTIWTLIEMCFDQARRFEELLATPVARRQLAFARDSVLSDLDRAS